MNATCSSTENTTTQERLESLIRSDSSRLQVPRVLSIAGTDPTGGAGLHADIKSITAAGGYAMAVTTALVAQNTQGVTAVHQPPIEFLEQQLEAVFSDVTVDAVKIGMLFDAATIATVRRILQKYPVQTVVLDPVMVATSGDRLLQADAERALREFVQDVTVVTPNIPELAVLCECEPATTLEEAHQQARNLAAATHTTVIVKLGHLTDSDAGNSVVHPDGTIVHIPALRVHTSCTHGTGCSLSSALATRLCIDPTVAEALHWVTQWLNDAIVQAHHLHVGHGHGPIDHSVWMRHALQEIDTTPWNYFADITYDDKRNILTMDSKNSVDNVHTNSMSYIPPKAFLKFAGPWTEQLWSLGGKYYEKILRMPFIQQLANGALQEERFTFFLQQDAQYLAAFGRALSVVSAKSPHAQAQQYWASSAHGCLVAETELHRDWLATHTNTNFTTPSPITLSYNNFLEAITNNNDYVVGAAAVLPCHWLYAEIGLALAQCDSATHPYHTWLAAYGSDAYDGLVQQCIDMVEQAFEQATPEQRVRAAQAYLTACEYEYEFFDQAYRLVIPSDLTATQSDTSL